jgi:hypothetical protein
VPEGKPIAPAVSRAFPLTRLTSWQRYAVILVVGFVLFGVLVEFRAAFLQRRMGDLDVFMRTAWAVRSGQDIYTATDPNGFHYHYPPLLAILLVPLADPPTEADPTWAMPYPVTVALWYAVSVLCLGLAVHWLASSLEQTSPDAALRSLSRGCPRWWALRLVPIVACLPPIGHTLMRGQVNLLLLLLLCGMAAALLHGRRGQSGWWLAWAICLKVIPGFLLLVPLWRRDGRCLFACLLGLVLGIGVIPAVVFGPARTWTYYREWNDVLLRPGLGTGADQSRAKELINVTGTDSQSFQAILHNSLHPDPATRPPHPATWVRAVHWLVGLLMTALTLLAAWRQRGDGPGSVIAFGSLVLIMLLLSPVCHLHYFCLSLPLVMGLLAASWEGKADPRLGKGMMLLLAVNVAANALPYFAGPDARFVQLLRDDGLATGAGVLLWLVGLIVLWQRGRRALVLAAGRPHVVAAAA